jgi:hypothetical protein
MLRSAYGDLHPWRPWKFPKGTSPEYWKDPINQRFFLDQLASDLNITSPKQWYSVTKEDIRQHGGRFLR